MPSAHMAGRIVAHVREHYRKLFDGELESSVDVARGPQLARALGCPAYLQTLVGERDWAAFAPCGNPVPLLGLRAGQRLLDLGCGVGVDGVAVRLELGGRVQVVGLDAVAGVLARAGRLARQVLDDAEGVGWLCGDAAALPFQDDCFDAASLNGLFNLLPDKAGLMAELARVLRPGGRLVIADLAASQALPDYFADELDAWAWCMSGALTEAALVDLLGETGFDRVEITRAQPCTRDADCPGGDGADLAPYCVAGNCAFCWNDEQCPDVTTCIDGPCLPPGLCYGMLQHPSLIYGTWLIGVGAGMEHFSYFRFEPDGSFRRGQYIPDGAPSATTST